MTSEPDNQFREGLEQHRSNPSPYAWGRIEAGLHRRKILRNQFKVAATLLLLMSAVFMMWRSNKTPTQPMLTSQEYSTNSTAAKNQVVEPSMKDMPPKEIVYSSPDQIVDAPESKKTFSIKKEVDVSQVIPSRPDSLLRNDSWTTEVMQPVEDSIVSDILEPTEMNIPDKERKTTNPYLSKTIVYSSQEMNTRFLKKSLLIASADNPKSESGFRKVLDFAGDLKNNEFSLGDLRQIKNEFLSIPVQNQVKTK